MVTKKEIQHLAKLARLELDDDEAENFKKDLNKILDYVSELNKADTSGISEILKTTWTENEMRQDLVELDYRARKSEMLGKILKEAPEIVNGYFKVPPILDKNNR